MNKGSEIRLLLRYERHSTSCTHPMACMDPGIPHQHKSQVTIPQSTDAPLPLIVPERGCEWIEWVELPDFPEFLGNFEFTLPPLPNLTPWGVQKWQVHGNCPSHTLSSLFGH